MPTRAPSPRKVAAAKAPDEGHKIITLTDTETGESFTLDLDGLGPGDDRICRAATGMPATAYYQGSARVIGADSVAVFWWLAQVKAGRKVDYHQVEQSLGSANDIQARFEVDIQEPVDDDGDGPDPTGG